MAKVKHLKRIAMAVTSIVMASVFTFSVAACTDTTDTSVSGSSTSTSDSTSTSGSTSTSSSDTGTSTSPSDGDSTTTADTYTYRDYLTASPTTWNPHTWSSDSDSEILDFNTMGFYDLQLTYDEDGNADGYEWVCEMASAFPEDVTSDYVGSWGISSGDTAKVWKIALNEDACWDDGTPITADDYVYSMKEQLNPLMFNRRSDSYTSGTFSVYGAKKYLYSESTEIYNTPEEAGYSSVQDALDAGETVYVDCWNFWGAEGYVDEDGNECPQYVSITDTTTYDTADAWTSGVAYDDFSGADLWAVYGSYLEVGGSYAEYLTIIEVNSDAGYAYEYSSDGSGGVGVIKTGDYEITIILNNEITEFYVLYSLTSNWLVREDLYEKCKVVVSDSYVTTTYGTTLATTASYGPYTLNAYVYDSYFTLKKNEYWYGYTDGKHEGQYQTTDIYYYILESSTAKATSLELFMSGLLDGYSLTGSEMADYGASTYLLTTPASYTYQFFLCTNQTYLNSESSSDENHAVLGLESFRKAISFAVNRNDYCSTFQPASQAGFGILNYMYVYDPDTGAVYRDTEDAKRVSLLYAGYTEGTDGTWTDHNGSVYDDLEEAYESITGYDVEYAAELFAQAYAEAKSEGYISQYGSDVVITYTSVGAASTNTTNLIAMINEWFAEALAETPEGTETFSSITIEYDYYATESEYWAALKNGEMDLSFSAWGGSSFDPWGIIWSCYIDPSNSNNYGFDTMAKSKDVTIEIKGTEYTYSLYDWASWMNANQDDDYYTSASNNLYTKFGLFANIDDDYSTRVAVLSACELAMLETTVTVPIFYSYSNSIKTAKFEYGSDTYLQLIGYGGIRHITYNYTDAEWDAYVTSMGGNLESLYKS